jgi:hypothetical protein
MHCSSLQEWTRHTDVVTYLIVTAAFRERLVVVTVLLILAVVAMLILAVVAMLILAVVAMLILTVVAMLILAVVAMLLAKELMGAPTWWMVEWMVEWTVKVLLELGWPVSSP